VSLIFAASGKASQKHLDVFFDEEGVAVFREAIQRARETDEVVLTGVSGGTDWKLTAYEGMEKLCFRRVRLRFVSALKGHR
jgi:threonine dehydrogenase-like Zn-dependent dehydrogenase